MYGQYQTGREDPWVMFLNDATKKPCSPVRWQGKLRTLLQNEEEGELALYRISRCTIE
jgi:hypothetical protein